MSLTRRVLVAHESEEARLELRAWFEGFGLTFHESPNAYHALCMLKEATGNPYAFAVFANWLPHFYGQGPRPCASMLAGATPRATELYILDTRISKIEGEALDTMGVPHAASSMHIMAWTSPRLHAQPKEAR